MKTKANKTKWFRVTFDAEIVMDMEGERWGYDRKSNLWIINGAKKTVFNPRQWTSICEIDPPVYGP